MSKNNKEKEFKSIENIEKEESKKKASSDHKDLKELIRNTVVMLAITLIAGGILGFVYELTKEPIEAMELQEKEEANKAVFPTADSFKESSYTNDYLATLLGEDFSGVDVEDCLEAYDAEGNLLGYNFTVISHEGYGGDIEFSMGVMLDGTLNGISITSISETAGLGMRAEEVLVPQFKNKTATSFEVTKSGAVMENQIDAISSATITSKAVTKGVNAGLTVFRALVSGGEANE